MDIRNVKSSEDLVRYFIQNLNWNIDEDDFDEIDDISYDFDADDLGLKREEFSKINSLKQLQQISDNQKWGIFCVEFESKRFEVSALRKILSRFIPKKRNSADHAVWDQNDLLFLCFWGKDNNRTIGIAHFDDKGQGLPQIRMISCEPAIEERFNIANFESRLSRLRWVDDENDTEKWYEQWSSAFVSGYREVIRSSHELTKKMANKAREIRDQILRIYAVENERGYVHKLFKDFKNSLIHDLSEKQFADMYAQTVVYGLFSAKCMDTTHDDFDARKAVNCLPNTNPFLRRLMRDCLGEGNRKMLTFDELEVSDIVDLLRHTDTELIVNDFNRMTGGGREDPVIHFYEEFLNEYDGEQKKRRGVYYTPQPVVNFIVRAVDDILKNEFGLADGLASEETKEIMAEVEGKKRRERQTVPAVQILDPATGTGTFLRQTILQIYDNFCKKHEGESKEQIKAAWNEYVPKHLLPRLNGFELMMAPYAVAHMKLAMVLKDTGYDFGSNERLNVFLTNSLEEPGNSEMQISLFDDPLAFESVEANQAKKNNGINVIIGNPPYSVSSSNKGTWILSLLSSYKQNLNEKKLNLDDDYIKFIRYGEYLIHQAGKGVLAYISNNSFIDGVTHRQMRKELLQEFDSIYIIDLHGSSKKHEKTPEGDKDENVFDIQQGVSINIFLKKSISSQNATVYHLDVFGLRTYKYDYLNNVVFSTIKWKQVLYEQPYFFFVPKDLSAKQQYEVGFSMLELFEINNSGIKTDRDTLFIDVDKFSLADRIRTLLSGNITDNFKKEYRVENSSSYRLTEKIQNKNYNEKFIKSIVYRPFDSQWIYYDPTIISRPGYNTMQHMLHDNYGLYVKRGFEDSDSPPVFCCDKLICMRAWSRPGSIGSEYLFPLFKYSYHLGKLIKSPNFNTSIINKIENSLNIKLNNGFNPLDLFSKRLVKTTGFSR